MKKIWDLLKVKGNNVWSIGPDASVYDAMALMADKGVGALMVMEGAKLVGVMSERDYARKIILMGRSSKKTPIKEIMTTRVLYVQHDQSVKDCMALMTEKRIRHLPVMDGEKLIGVISIGDIVKSIIADQRVYIEQLEQYIKGG